MTECISTCKSYLHISDIQINHTPYNSSSLSHGQKVLDVAIKGTTEEPMRCEVRLIIKNLSGTPLANYIPGCYTGKLIDVQPGAFSIERHIQLPKYMADGDYLVDLYLHEPYRQDFFQAKDCMTLHIEGFYDDYAHTLVLPTEGFIGLEPVELPKSKV